MTHADFLAAMAQSSRARAQEAMARVDAREMRARIQHLPTPPTLSLTGQFDLIAELKLTSPAMGVLAGSDEDLEARVVDYASAKAAAVSVLTEPDRFSGSLEHLRRAADALREHGVPAMRKDFLVDPYQVLEARDAGAGGILLIVRMLEPSLLRQMMDVAADLGLFVLLETFDLAEVEVAQHMAAHWPGAADHCLIGVNSRDLVTLKVVPERLDELASQLPDGFPRVAESGLSTPEDAARLAAAGYTVALVGTALMSSADPKGLAREMIRRGRAQARS